jgi:hypothetical protein
MQQLQDRLDALKVRCCSLQMLSALRAVRSRGCTQQLPERLDAVKVRIRSLQDVGRELL